MNPNQRLSELWEKLEPFTTASLETGEMVIGIPIPNTSQNGRSSYRLFGTFVRNALGDDGATETTWRTPDGLEFVTRMPA